MRKLSKGKWLTASCGIICLATFLALTLNVPGKLATGMGGSSKVSNVHWRRPASTLAAASRSNENVIKHYGQLPLAFEPNQSQTDARVKFLARGNGYMLFLTDREAVLELRGQSKTPAVVRMELKGGNPAPDFSALDQLAGKSNYFIGNNPKKWRTNIPQYRRVIESNVYRGVNLVYYGSQGRLEYDFDVAPGADPSLIHLAFDGTRHLRIGASGELVADTAAGEVRLLRPVAYQERDGSRHPVAVGYVLKDTGHVSFQVAKYDPRRPLVIDPILAYSTYLGGSNIDSSNAIAVAPDNTAFVAGGTFSSDFPTAHPLQPDVGGPYDYPQDAFVSKISADGSTLLYSTYLGGESQDTANGIAVDTFGNAYVVGTTESPDFPNTPSVFGENCGGDGKCGASYNPGGLIVSNAFVTKLNAAGSALAYSGFLGFYEYVKGNAIAVDANGNAYVTGQVGPNIQPTVVTTSPPPPFPDGSAIQTPYIDPTNDFDYGINAVSNAFVTVISSTGSSITYSSYLGGTNEDVGYGIAVDSSANAYVTGLAYSTNFPTTTGALQTTNGGAGDAFFSKINTAATGAASLLYSTFLGGSGLDQGNGITVDSSGNTYIAGLTSSASFGFTPAGYQPTYAGEGDAFIAKFTSAGALSYFTYLGGNLADQATGIAVDSSGNAYVTGTTVSTNFPTAGAVFQPAYGGGNSDSFVAKIGPTGTTLVYSSFLGGTNTELATGIAVDTSGSAYVTGQTCSDDFPLANPLQAVPGGNCDAYIAKISILDGIALNPAGLIFPAQSLNTTSEPQTVTVTNGDNPQTITSIAISGTNATDFAETTTCGSSLAIGSTCTITVSFTPAASGIRKASLVITGSAPGSPQVVNLTGNTSTVTLSASSLSFGTQQVGTPSAPQAVTVTNSGTTSLTISSISASGDFSETDNCTKAVLQPTTNCVIQVTFTPSAAVSDVGSITLNDNGSGSPQEILVTGTGILEPQALVTPASLGFASQDIGAASAPQVVTLSNTGDAALSVSNIVTTGDFSDTSTCGSILSPNASCAISVTFTPSVAGNRSGTLTVTDNTGNVTGSTQTVQLSGVGLAVPVVTLSSTALTFTSQAIGTTSAAQMVTLTNTGSAALNITSVTSSGDFAQINNCAASIAVGKSCTINVTFTPTLSGNRFGSVTITDNSTNSPQTISISGTGTGANFQITAPTPSVSVPAGQAASYGLIVSSYGGFTQPVTLSCSGAPAGTTCSFSPAAVTPSAAPSTTSNVTLTLSTALRTIAPPGFRIKMDPFLGLRQFGVNWFEWMIVTLIILTAAVVRRRPFTAAFGFAVVLLLASVACGGGVSGVPAGTPAGTYQITITGTSGTTTSSMQVTLQVN